MKNIFERMSAITAEISAVAKNLQVDTGKSSYKAAGEADVLAAVKPVESKHGVYSYPVEREIIESAVIATQRNGYETKQQFMRLRVVYRFVNMDRPEEYMDITTYGDGVDSQDKAPGKAMTYADKYALMKAYKIITGDDPDQKASEDLVDKKAQTIAPAAVAALKKRCETDGVPEKAVCDHLGIQAISDMTDKQHAYINKYWQKVVEKYGRKESDAVS